MSTIAINKLRLNATVRLNYSEMTMDSKSEKVVQVTGEHYKDYPNDIGFGDIAETRTPVEMKVTGVIPEYVTGVLYRTGPGSYTTPMKNGKIFKIQHWFDGFALQHRFEITEEGRVFYRSRRTCDEYIQNLQNTGHFSISFGQRDLCDSMFHKFFTMFKSDPTDDTNRNVQVTLTPNFPVGPKLADKSHRNKSGIQNLYVKTDANVLRSLDPVTLDPIESLSYTKLIPELSGGVSSASHPAVDPDTGELFNYVLKYGRVPTYTLFKLIPATAEKEASHKILAKITDAPAAYIHSVCLTKNYFVFCVWQADYKLNGAAIPYYKNLCEAFGAWDPKRRTLWYIIDREEGGIIRKFESDPFFAFHHINSFDDSDDIVVDLVTFPTHEVVNSFYLDVLRSTTATKGLEPPPSVTRVRLPNVTEAMKTGIGIVTKTDVFLELPTICADYSLKRNKFAYGVSGRDLSSLWDCVLKVDLEALYANPSGDPENAIKRYERLKCTPSEPIFVPRPGATREDDGVVLIVELDGVRGKSALVVLDAQSFKEVGRAEVEGKGIVISHGFHGAWVNL